VDNEKEIERANSYRDMMNLWAFKDLYSEIEEIRKVSLESAISSATIESVYEARGKVKGIDQLLSTIEHITSFQKI